MTFPDDCTLSIWLFGRESICFKFFNNTYKYFSDNFSLEHSLLNEFSFWDDRLILKFGDTNFF